LTVTALLVPADLAKGIGREVEAALALPHLAARRKQGISECADLFFRLAQQVQGKPLGRARSDAGQAFELIDQPGQGTGEAAQRSAAGGTNLGGLIRRRAGAGLGVGAQAGAAQISSGEARSLQHRAAEIHAPPAAPFGPQALEVGAVQVEAIEPEACDVEGFEGLDPVEAHHHPGLLAGHHQLHGLAVVLAFALAALEDVWEGCRDDA
jgi:hypothetical protein